MDFVQAFGCKNKEEVNIRNSHQWKLSSDSSSYGRFKKKFSYAE